MTVETERRVAIIGMSLRFPGADSPTQYWQAIHHGRSYLRRFTPEDFAAVGVRPELYGAEEFVGASGVLPRIAEFDRRFFSMSAKEAVLTDPQHRLFLETCQHALEDAGYAGTHAERSTASREPAGRHEAGRFRDGDRVGVFASSGYHMYSLQSYLHNNVLDEPPGDGWIDRMQRDVGGYPDFTASRAAFRLGLTGPAIGVQTACSSSLVGVHLARQSLLSSDADLAVAGAAAVHVPQILGYRHVVGSILSRTGRCRAFDAASDGTVAGSGVAAIVLKRLDRALADGDTVHAVILGSAVNNDGWTKRHFTEPSAAGQRTVVRQALAAAEVPASSIGYLEAHGTGTFKGDPIEFAALTEVFREQTSRRGYCGIGSVKANVGHLDVCSGLAGLIKAALVLRQGTVPPLAGFTAPNPLLEVAGSPFFLPERPQPWGLEDGPRRAGVTSLGVGGTNAHVVLEQAPAPGRGRAAPRVPAGPAQLRHTAAPVDQPAGTESGPSQPPLPLHGHEEQALRDNARALRDHLTHHPELSPADLVTTLALGRRQLRHRLVVQGDTTAGLVRALNAFLASESDTGESGGPDRVGHGGERWCAGVVPRTRLAPLAWVFSGQGGAWPGMARALYRRFAVVREVLDRCEELFRDEYGGSLLDRLLGEPARPATEEGADRSPQCWPTATAQPALFALQAAQTRLWQQLVGQPAVVAGHSVGEYAALFAAGALSLDNGLRLTAERGRLMQDGCQPGGMLSVRADPQTVLALREDEPEVELAVVNGARQQVFAGPLAGVERAGRWLTARRVPWHRLPVDRAFHSGLVDPVLDELVGAARRADLGPTQLPLITGVDGARRPAGWTPEPDYLRAQARQPMRFDLVLAALDDLGSTVRQELGPDRVLSTLSTREGGDAHTLPTQRTEAGLAPLWEAVAQLHCQGYPLDWRTVTESSAGRRIPLPGYAFQRQTYWTGPALVEPVPVARPEQVHALELEPLGQPEPPSRSGPEPSFPPVPSDLDTFPQDQERPGKAVTDVDHIRERIRSLTAQQLGGTAAEVAPDVPFFDLGADSLQMITTLRDLEAEFGVKVAMRELFDEADTPELLAQLIADRSGRPTEAAAGPPPSEPSPSGPTSSGPPTSAPVPTVPAAPATAPSPEAPATRTPPPEPGVPASPGPYATQAEVAALTEQVRQLTESQIQLMSQLSLLLERQLAAEAAMTQPPAPAAARPTASAPPSANGRAAQ